MRNDKVQESRLTDPEELFRKAELAEERGDMKKAFDCLLKAAQLGHVSCQINLGNFYASGRGVRKDLARAAFWYKTAYRSGDSSGAFCLAIDRRNEGKLRSSIAWFTKAAAMNHGSACLELAKLYLSRRGGHTKAKELLIRTRTMTLSEISEDENEEAATLLASLKTVTKS